MAKKRSCPIARVEWKGIFKDGEELSWPVFGNLERNIQIWHDPEDEVGRTIILKFRDTFPKRDLPAVVAAFQKFFPLVPREPELYRKTVKAWMAEVMEWLRKKDAKQITTQEFERWRRQRGHFQTPALVDTTEDRKRQANERRKSTLTGRHYRKSHKPSPTQQEITWLRKQWPEIKEDWPRDPRPDRIKRLLLEFEDTQDLTKNKTALSLRHLSSILKD